MEHKNAETIKISLKNEIDGNRKRFIVLEQLLSAAEQINSDMPVFLQSPVGQAVFTHVISSLIEDQVITPVGKPINARGLYSKYRVIQRVTDQTQNLRNQIVQTVLPPAKIDYYLKNPQDYLLDQPIIDQINAYLKQATKDWITVNERAYELFGDEKFFRGAGKGRSRGETVLKRLGLSYSDLACEETVEPFFSFQKQGFSSLTGRNIYIVENKDTFWSMKRTMMDSPSQIVLDMLIYGEGKKILSSFQFVEDYHINPELEQFYYFGDLDPEGISIYRELTVKYPQYKILPFYPGYLAILQIGLNREPSKTPNEQRVNQDHIDRFCHGFAPAWATQLRNHLINGFYIPQEALSATEMKIWFGCVNNE